MEGDRELAVSADRGVLRLAIANVLDNAIKYTPNGGAIELRVSRVAQLAEVAVRDSGPGIAAEHRAHVFDRFYRVDAARSRSTGGFGLGLAIARWAVEVHGGEIDLDDDRPGCVFRIRIPR